MKNLKNIDYILLLKLLFSSILIIGSIISLLIANGNAINVNQGSIEKKGVLEINSNPSDVSVYLNEKYLGIGASKYQNLDIAEAEIKLEKEGYNTWKKTIQIKEGQITQVDAKLYPIESKLDQLVESPIISQVFEKDKVRYITNENGELTIWEYRKNSGILGRNEQNTRLGAISKDLTENFIKNGFTFDTKENIGIIKSLEKIYYFDISQIQEIKELNDILGFTPDKVNILDSNYLLVEAGKVVFWVDINTYEKTLLSIDSEKVLMDQNLTSLIYQNQMNKSLSIFSSSKVENIYPIDTIDEVKMGEYFQALDEIIPNITSIKLPEQTNDIVILTTNTGIYWWNRKVKVLVPIKDDLETPEILDVSITGENILVKNNSETQLFSLKKNTISKSYDVDAYTVMFSSLDQKVSFSKTGSELVWISKVGELSKIEVSDLDSKNKVTILESEKLSNSESFYISPDQKRIWIVSSPSKENEYYLFEIVL